MKLQTSVSAGTTEGMLEEQYSSYFPSLCLHSWKWRSWKTDFSFQNYCTGLLGGIGTFVPPRTSLASLGILGRAILSHSTWSYNQDRICLQGWVQDTHECLAQCLITCHTTRLASVNIGESVCTLALSFETPEETHFSRAMADLETTSLLPVV